MSRYYDRAGKPLSLAEWAVSFGRQQDKVVEQTALPNNRRVSTVWLGLNHQYGDGPPLIFETLVFHDDCNELDCERYTTEEEAQAGHARMVAKWTGAS